MRPRTIYAYLPLSVILSSLLINQTSFSLKLNSIDAITDKDSTRVMITFDKPLSYDIKSVPGGLEITVAGVSKVKCENPLFNDDLVSKIDIEKEKKLLKINITTTKRAKRFISYKSENEIVLYVVIKAGIEESIIEDMEKQYEPLRNIKCLIVDDDDGYKNGNTQGGIDVDDYYTRIFDEEKLGWEKKMIMHNAKSISNVTIQDYNLVIWLTGLNAIPEAINIEKMRKIRDYIDKGGKIIIVSQNLFSDSPPEVIIFFKNLLGIEKVYNDTKIDSVIYLPYSKEPKKLSLISFTAPTGNWGDGMVLSGSEDLGNEIILKGTDDKFYGIASKKAGVALFTVEIANIDSPYTRLDIIKSAIDVIMSK